MDRIRINTLSDHIGKETVIAGWVDVRRDHGKLIFLDIRDASGKVQCVALPNHEDAYKTANELRPEWVIRLKGKINPRPDNMKNEKEDNGDIEMEVLEIEVLSEAETPPFDLSTEGYEINEETRLEYRYLDLRRGRLKENIEKRAAGMHYIRNFLYAGGFEEIETPILGKSTPEGARDYLVPARSEPGKFYALPQSPQQYKQLLMAAGFEKYFQIARCMRDEDTRGDRQPEFTQLDLEMSFVTQEDILKLTEKLFTGLVKDIFPEKKVTETPWPRLNYDDVMKEYGTDRPDLRKDKDDPDELAFAWILNFPLFEKEKTGKHFAPEHHMFTAPKEEDIEKLDKKPEEVRSLQHDLVLNGNEVGGGSIRIHDPEIQKKIFKLIGFGKKEQEHFNHMLKAFTFGIPPHGGIAPGLDRLFMVLLNEPNIREVIAFPKTGEGRDLMMGAPEEVDDGQLKDLGIKAKKK